jgi:hypothetical protein
MMDEQAALDISAVRALETHDLAKAVWTDADRAWASRAAAEVVGEGADAAAFVARRARLALERIGERYKALPRAARALHWRPWIAWITVVGAFMLGVAVDRIGGAQRINLLAPPLFALVTWNLGAYLVLAAGFVVGYGDTGNPGPVRRLVMRVASRSGMSPLGRPKGEYRSAQHEGSPVSHGGGGSARDDASRIIGASIAAMTGDWFRLAAPLYTMRAARILHFAAAALALGVIAGLYVRGLAFEYRATWESTFLDAASVHWLLAMLLAPGSALSGIAMPGVAQLESIRAPASENAAPWLHLLAASALAIVVIPRLLLGIVAGGVERHRAARVAIPLGEPYYQRLLRGFRGGPVRVRVIPYSYALPPAVRTGLEAIVTRAFGGSAALTVEPAVSYGDEDTLAQRVPGDGKGPVIAVFNLTATPEPAAHGAFVKAAAGVGRACPLLAFVDESAFRARWPGDDRRLAQRRGIWSELLTDQRVVPIFLDLAAPDLGFAEAAIDAALAARDTIEPASRVPS